MGQFSSYIESLKTQTDILRSKITDKTGIDSSNFTLADCADAISNIRVVEPNLVSKTIIENGTYNAIDDSVDGYSNIVVSVGESLDTWIDMPNEFVSSINALNTFPVNSDLTIFSNVDAGTWIYSASKNNFKKLLDLSVSAVLSVRNKCWLGVTGRGAYLYDIQTGECVQHITLKTNNSSNDQIAKFELVENKCLICQSDYILLHDLDTDTVTQLYNRGCNNNFRTIYIKHLRNHDCILGGWGIKTDLLVYIHAEGVVKPIFEGGNYYEKIVELSNGDCIITPLITSYFTGILLYKASEHAIYQLYTTGYNWNNIIEVPNGNCLISNTGSSSSVAGILLYDAVSCSIIKAYSSAYNWDIVHNLSNGDCLISSKSNSSATGILRYNANDNSISKIYSNYYNWIYFQEMPNGFCILSNTSTKGFVIYNMADATSSLISSTYTNWAILKPLPDGNCLMSGKSSATLGISLYNSETQTISRIYSSGYNWDTYTIIGNDCLITSSEAASSDGVLLYRSDMTEISQLYKTGRQYTNFTSYDNGFYIKSTDTKKYPNLLYYKGYAIKPVKFNLGAL